MRFKEGDIVRVLPRPDYAYGIDADATTWEGTVTTIKIVWTDDIMVNAAPFHSSYETKLSTYSFREDELELAKDHYLEQFYKQL